MNRLSSRARWLALGLLLALAAALYAEHWLWTRTGAAQDRFAVQRAAVLNVRALAEVTSRAGGQGEGVRAAVDRFAAAVPDLENVRVVDFKARTLEASTAPEDAENPAPRRLAREEKPLYDQAQRLRAAAETNLQEGVSRKDEVEIEAREDGGFVIAAPVEPEGEMRGAVIAEHAPPPASAAPGWGFPGLLLIVALALYLALAIALGDRPVPLVASAVVLLLAAIGIYAVSAVEALANSRQEAERRVAEHLVSTAELAEATLAEIASGLQDEAAPAETPDKDVDLAATPVPAPLEPASWDADVYRNAFGIVRADGSLDAEALGFQVDRTRSRVGRTVLTIAAASLPILFFIGLGWAARLVITLHRFKLAYLYVLPAIVAMIVLVFLPFGYGIGLSFTESTLYNEADGFFEKWIGTENYVDILSDTSVMKRTESGLAYDYENFYWTLGFTIVWTVVNVAFGVTLGLFLALILNRKGLVLKPIYRVLLILPWAVPNYITALIWKGMFHQQFGVVNQVFQMVGLEPVAWFEGAFTSFLAIWATNGWLSFPFMMVISLGALQSIPADLYEAAKVDGASRWQQFVSVTLPSLKPALVPAIILSVIWTFNMFNIPYLTSGGEPAHATEILITGAYKIAFQKYQYGYAAAYATIIFVILLVYGIWQNKVTKATEGV